VPYDLSAVAEAGVENGSMDAGARYSRGFVNSHVFVWTTDRIYNHAWAVGVAIKLK
jgi:hypothetical protein